MEDRSKLKSENILTKVPITENNLPSPPDGNDYLLIREVNTEIPEQMTENTYYTSNEAVLDKKGVIGLIMLLKNITCPISLISRSPL